MCVCIGRGGFGWCFFCGGAGNGVLFLGRGGELQSLIALEVVL